jgi:rhodanese-related sulfurtransferase
MAPFEDMDCREVKRRLGAGERLVLLDVREKAEWDRCRLEGARLMPLSEMDRWVHQLDPDGGPYVVYCHHGVRSRFVCGRLAAVGLRGLINLRGGIDAWSQTVDPSVPTY